MRIALAYLSVIILWSTTPLAIKWSGEGPGFLFGATSRMTLGAICMLLLLLISRKPLPLHKKAKQTYLIVSIQIYGAMLAVYWGAQHIPSGWVSVIFGLSPFITSLFAAIWLAERNFTFGKFSAYILGISGLSLMFSSAFTLNIHAVYGMFAVLLAVSLQTASAVWVKRTNARLPAATQVTGGLLLALPAYLLTWLIVDQAQWPQHLTLINIASIVYLGVVASTFGFVLYYYVLIHLSATSVGMIPLISPVFALYIGHTINHEPFTLKIVLGTGLILSALIIHEFFDQFLGLCFKQVRTIRKSTHRKT